MRSDVWKWVLGLSYIVAVATIWIAASFVVQSVVDEGVSPFLITYICNSLFVIYIPLFEIGRFLEDTYGGLCFWRNNYKTSSLRELGDSEEVILLGESKLGATNHHITPTFVIDNAEVRQNESDELVMSSFGGGRMSGEGDKQLDAKGRWSRVRVAKASLLICPFWFLAQLCFNVSLKYTTVTSNTILSTSSSLFTFLVSLVFLGEKFTWLKLISVLLCMLGTIIVSMGDSKIGFNAIATNPFLGDLLALVSAGLYAVYITLIRKKLPDEDGKDGHASMAQFLGYLGFFNLLIFMPIALVLHLTKLEPFTTLTWKQFGLVVGKGLLDNVLSDYLWAKAVLLTSTTVATAGLTIQVPLAAVVDSITGHAPGVMDYIGAAAVMVGFAGINIPSDVFCRPKEVSLEVQNNSSSINGHISPINRDTDI